MTENLAAVLRLNATFVAIMALAGCSIFAPAPELPPAPVIPEPVAVVETPPPVIEEPEPAPVEAVVPAPEPLPSIAIVITNAQPAYADVATELASHFERFELYDLSNRARAPASVLRIINDSDSSAVVAIGMRAATTTVAMSQIPVVFSQVFNYQDKNLLTENSRGVASIAPLDAQIGAWKEFDPTISKVGAVIGEGHEDLIADAKIAAERHGVELRVHVTRSDQETLYFFKRMIQNIDGFWLFPDNRVLSRRALQQIMDDAQRHNVPVLAPTESMLQMGATISVSSVPSDIAKTITEVVREIQQGDIESVPPMTALSEVIVRTSDTVQVVER